MVHTTSPYVVNSAEHGTDYMYHVWPSQQNQLQALTLNRFRDTAPDNFFLSLPLKISFYSENLKVFQTSVSQFLFLSHGQA